MTHLLDSSAFLAFFFGEPGAGRINELLHDTEIEPELSALTCVEFWARLSGFTRGFGRIQIP